MTTLSVESRTNALNAFKACLPIIWDGREEGRYEKDEDGRYKQTYICCALQYGPYSHWSSAVSIIERSLGDAYTYESWLRANGVEHPHKQYTTVEIQAARVRFVNACIEALQKSLK